MKPYLIILKINDKIHYKYRLFPKLLKTCFSTTVLQIFYVSMIFWRLHNEGEGYSIGN